MQKWLKGPFADAEITLEDRDTQPGEPHAEGTPAMTTDPTPARTRRLSGFARAAVGSLPRDTRFALFRRMVACDPNPDPRLTLGIARTRDDLEACFSLLHDAYVSSGFMRPHPSGLRVTPYHALPTTTTLYARYDEQIVGTLSIIREGVFGFPMQAVFDLTAVRARPGRIAEISALAVHPDHRKTGGTVLFPLMKFMYEYCTRYFDTRHLVIAVNPRHIDMYESLLLFSRLQAQVVANYDFVNGAPAVGATLDLAAAPEMFRQAYGGRRPERNLHHYFTEVSLPNIRFPGRPYYTTNDPVMTPELLDHFFMRRTRVFDTLDDRRRQLLQAIYPEPEYRGVLPEPGDSANAAPLRRHRRYSLKCPARLLTSDRPQRGLALDVIDASKHGFLARCDHPLADGTSGTVRIRLGADIVATEDAAVVRRITGTDGGEYYGFHIATPGVAWRAFIDDLERQDAPDASPRGLVPAADTASPRPASTSQRKALQPAGH
jgi:GNAT superfamily N-acetyltransferase